MSPSPPNILARGPWAPEQIGVSWSDQTWQPPPELEQAADKEVEALRRRSSPSHDGLAARLAGWHETGDGELMATAIGTYAIFPRRR